MGLERRALTLVGEVMGLLDLEEFSHGLLQALRAAVPAEWGALNEVPADLPRTISLTDPPVPAEVHVAFARTAEQNPIAAHFLRTRDGRATRISDLISRRELHRLDLYREVYQALDVEYQIAFTLPSSSGRILGAVLSRARRDFMATERDLLNLCRPYLIEAYRNARAHTSLTRNASGQLAPADLEALGISPRQAQVLALVATGHSSREVATTLGVSVRTVQKHLELCYRTLNVTSRWEASRVAWAAC